jgi:hypothetical protein
MAAIAATWLAFCLALGLALPQPPHPLHLALGALAGAVLVVGGFSAGARWRPVPERRLRERLRLAGLSLLAGAALGALLLVLLIAFARVEPAIRARFAGRLTEPAWRPWALGFESSILEEVSFRLFAMSGIAWVVSRLLRNPGAATAVALGLSSLLFGLAHLPAWLAITVPTAALLVGVLALNGIGGLLFGWIFWRWGLPYAILCHAAGDVVVQSLGPRLL